MSRRDVLWAALPGLPLADANTSQARTFTCPPTGQERPCSKCCPLDGSDERTPKAEGFTCPVTGEQLPCEKCCPLNGTNPPQEDQHAVVTIR